MHSPTLANDFASRSTLASAPFQPLLSRCARCFPKQIPCSQTLTDSFSLLALFFALASFVFSSLQTLFAKRRGVWGTSAKPPRPLRLSVILCPCFCRPPRRSGAGICVSLGTRHSSLATFLHLPLESTLAKVYQNKGLYLPLESTLVKNRGRGVAPVS